MLRGAVAANGTVSLGENGSFTYTPGSGFTGTDSFEYCIGDGIECDSSAATGLVSIVKPATVVDTYSTRVDQTLTVAAPGVLGNDTSLPMGARATRRVPVSSGTLGLELDGGFTYTPAAGFSGSVTFQYCVGDGFDGCFSEDTLVTINIANPTAVADSYSVQHDRVLTVPDPGVLGNDVNIPSDGRITQPGGALFGVLSANPSKAGGFTYTPNPGFSGTDSFQYCVGDGFDGCFTDQATATITVLAGPAAPTNVRVHPGHSVIAVEFTETPDSSVTGYTATCTQNVGGDAGIVTTTGSDTESPISVVGVVNGVLASCSVHATNATADGFESQPAMSTTPLVSSNPGVARNPTGTALPGRLSLSFDPPTSDGGAPIYRYAVDCFISTGSDSTGIARVFGTASPIVVDVPFDIPGFPPDDGLLVSCRLVAFNANGGSGFSATSTAVRVFPDRITRCDRARRAPWRVGRARQRSSDRAVLQAAEQRWQGDPRLHRDVWIEVGQQGRFARGRDRAHERCARHLHGRREECHRVERAVVATGVRAAGDRAQRSPKRHRDRRKRGGDRAVLQAAEQRWQRHHRVHRDRAGRGRSRGRAHRWW